MTIAVIRHACAGKKGGGTSIGWVKDCPHCKDLPPPAVREPAMSDETRMIIDDELMCSEEHINPLKVRSRQH